MIKPTIAELLEQVAKLLEESVLPELPPGEANVQLSAALPIIRRAAKAAHATGPYLFEDNRDIATTLQALLPSLGHTALADRIESAAADTNATASYHSVEDLAQVNETLQGLLIEAHKALGEAANHRLLPLYRRMLERESALIAPRSR